MLSVIVCVQGSPIFLYNLYINFFLYSGSAGEIKSKLIDSGEEESGNIYKYLNTTTVQCKNSEATIALGNFNANAGDESDEDITGGCGGMREERNWLTEQG